MANDQPPIEELSMSLRVRSHHINYSNDDRGIKRPASVIENDDIFVKLIPYFGEIPSPYKKTFDTPKVNGSDLSQQRYRSFSSFEEPEYYGEEDDDAAFTSHWLQGSVIEPIEDDGSMNDNELLGYLGFDVLNQFRSGVLAVSDLSRQMWCEQQLYFVFKYPYIINKEGEIKHVDDRPCMKAGTEIHEERELEMQDRKYVRCYSRADRLGIQLLNMILMLKRIILFSKLHMSIKIREVPIFGEPFSIGLYFRGIIDEICYDEKSNCLSVVEFKTRSSNADISSAQLRTHEIQVKVYFKLLHDLICGNVSKLKYIQNNRVSGTKRFTRNVQCEYNYNKIKAHDLTTAFDCLVQTAKRMIKPTCLRIAYVNQETRETIEEKTVSYDESNLKSTLSRMSLFWFGGRPPKGVDIEDCWKCESCAYTDRCEWYKKRLESPSESDKQTVN